MSCVKQINHIAPASLTFSYNRDQLWWLFRQDAERPLQNCGRSTQKRKTFLSSLREFLLDKTYKKDELKGTNTGINHA